MYCANCASPVSPGARFCGACGAALHREALASPAPVQPAFRDPRGRPRVRLGVGVRVGGWTLLAGILLIALGIAHMLLAMAGGRAVAYVTGYEREYTVDGDASTRDPNRYRLEYEFSVDGKRYTGSVTRVFEGGSHIRQTLPIRYLPFWPQMSAEDDAGAFFAEPLAFGGGILLAALPIVRWRHS